MKRVVLSAGGTGGHIFPALAVAEALHKNGAECLFVGSCYGPEGEWASKAGLPFVGLPVRGVLGRGLRSLPALAGLALSTGRALGILRRFGPDVVAGFGAYASFAPLSAAVLKGIPIVLHEQNAFPGVTNRLMARFARKICLSMPEDRTSGGQIFRGKCVWTGNPVRSAIRQIRPRSAEQRQGREPHLLVMGGSQGARAINSIVLSGLSRLLAAGVRIRHQAGKTDFERVRAGYGAYGLDVSQVTPFIDDMAEAYTWADLVLCRAGATSVAELAVAGKPAMFIPFPHATHDHQTANARAVCEVGAGLMVAEKDITQKDVVGMLLSLLGDTEKLQSMQQAALKQARPDAADAVAGEILKLCA